MLQKKKTMKEKWEKIQTTLFEIISKKISVQTYYYSKSWLTASKCPTNATAATRIGITIEQCLSQVRSLNYLQLKEN